MKLTEILRIRLNLNELVIKVNPFNNIYMISHIWRNGCKEINCNILISLLLY